MEKDKLILCIFLFSAIEANAEPIPDMFTRISQYCDVPAKILYAVAKTESNRKIAGQGYKPWPWTLNIKGKGYFFESREAQFKALMKAITWTRNVDIGYMQLNWHWKFDLLKSPWVATDPYFNVKTACVVLRKHYVGRAQFNWIEAAGRYHIEADTPKAKKLRAKYIKRFRSMLELLT